MIAKWIAQALMRGEDQLMLTTAELVEWQLSGCRVSLNMPRNSLGGYVEMHIRRGRSILRDGLTSKNPLEWVVGRGYIGRPGAGLAVYVPRLDSELAEDGNWRVPLIPPDPNHSLDAWTDDIELTADELQALKPLAKQLQMRMLLRCEFKTYVGQRKSIHGFWRDGRVALVALAGSNLIEFSQLFLESEPYTWSPPPNGDTVYESDYQAERRRIRRVRSLRDCGKPRTYLKRMKIIASTSNFIQEVSVRRIAALSDSFHVQFATRLLTAKNPKEQRTNFELVLDRHGLEALKLEIEQALKT